MRAGAAAQPSGGLLRRRAPNGRVAAPKARAVSFLAQLRRTKPKMRRKRLAICMNDAVPWHIVKRNSRPMDIMKIFKLGTLLRHITRGEAIFQAGLWFVLAPAAIQMMYLACFKKIGM